MCSAIGHLHDSFEVCQFPLTKSPLYLHASTFDNSFKSKSLTGAPMYDLPFSLRLLYARHSRTPHGSVKILSRVNALTLNVLFNPQFSLLLFLLDYSNSSSFFASSTLSRLCCFQQHLLESYYKVVRFSEMSRYNSQCFPTKSIIDFFEHFKTLMFSHIVLLSLLIMNQSSSSRVHLRVLITLSKCPCCF